MRVLRFGFGKKKKIEVFLLNVKDGSETEMNELLLGKETLRGIIFMKDERPEKLKKNEYTNTWFELSMGPRFLILDSAGFLHHFRCYEIPHFPPTISLFIRPLSIKEFIEKQKELKKKLKRLRKNRCKSVEISLSIQKKKRSNSQNPIKSPPSKIKLSYEFFLCMKEFIRF